MGGAVVLLFPSDSVAAAAACASSCSPMAISSSSGSSGGLACLGGGFSRAGHGCAAATISSHYADGVGPLLRRAASSRSSGGSDELGAACRGGYELQGRRRPQAPVEGEEAGGDGELHSLAEAGEPWGE